MRKWNWRRVIAKNEKDAVAAQVKEISGAEPGSQEYFKEFQTGLTEYCNGLTREQKDAAKATAREWNENGPSAEVQSRSVGQWEGYTGLMISVAIRSADKEAGRCISAFARNVFKRYGMHIFVLSAHKSVSGSIMTARLVSKRMKTPCH
jgi:hypothetical protein